MKQTKRSTHLRSLVPSVLASSLAAALPVALAALLLAPPPPAEAGPPPEGAKVKVLLVTGDDVPAHDWKATTPVLEEILKAAGRFEVKVSTDPKALAAALPGHDVVVLNFRDAKERAVPAEARQALRDFVASGKGLVGVHFAVAAFGDWKEYGDLVGRTWTPRVSGHGPKGTFKVSIAAKDHPITRGLSEFEIDDELYAALGGSKELNVLATAHSADFSKKTEPMAWTLEQGKGRVFVTVLGHDVKARKHPAFGALVARGTEWAATGKVAEEKTAAK